MRLHNEIRLSTQQIEINVINYIYTLSRRMKVSNTFNFAFGRKEEAANSNNTDCRTMHSICRFVINRGAQILPRHAVSECDDIVRKIDIEQ